MDVISAPVKDFADPHLLHVARTHQEGSHLGLERRLSGEEHSLLL